MSAVVCGKRNFFEEIHPPVPKRLRCAGEFDLGQSESSLGSIESPQNLADLLFQLKNRFAHMDDQLIEKVFESCGHNLDSTIQSLNNLCLSSGIEESTLAPQENDIDATSLEASNQQVLQCEGSKWVELFVQEMLSASNLDDAKDRAARALKAFEESITCRSGILLEDLQKGHAVLKEQLQTVVRDNHILKRAVSIQHERQVEHENCSQEINQLKQLISQYQEQVRTLEVNNYALTMHLKQAQEGSSISGRFHPDVF